MKNRDSNNSLPREYQTKLREYQATNEQIYHLQRLQVELTSILFSGIFLFIGLSLTSAIPRLLIVLFPAVIGISGIASVGWAFWYIYVERVIEVAIRRRRELEEKLGFRLEESIQEEIHREEPRRLLGFLGLRRLPGNSPFYLSFILIGVLIYIYIKILLTFN